MAAQPWPSTIDNCWLLAGFQQQNRPVTVRSQVEAGMDKVRRRFTRAVVNINADIKATKAELNIFQDFFNNTLQGGALRFSFTDPVLETVQEYRFVNPPVITVMTDKYFLLAMELERV